jgi:hypothetical protein
MRIHACGPSTGVFLYDPSRLCHCRSPIILAQQEPAPEQLPFTAYRAARGHPSGRCAVRAVRGGDSG